MIRWVQLFVSSASRLDRSLPPRVAEDFPGLDFRLSHTLSSFPRDAASFDLNDWLEADVDPGDFDVYLRDYSERGGRGLIVWAADIRDDRRVERALLQAMLRVQRLLARPQSAEEAQFLAIRRRHRALHNLAKPLVRADYDHAHDTWRWLLRLAPQASLALQTAALFHDIERLISESDVRIEHRAADYQAFKDEHARVGAQLLRDMLQGIYLSDAFIERVAVLVEKHERPAQDPDLQTLNDADALSFFSLNASGFLNYYGHEHTRRKVAYSLGRLRPDRQSWLDRIHFRADVAAIVREVRSASAPSDFLVSTGLPSSTRRVETL